MFENRTKPLISRRAFLLRMLRSVGLAGGIVAGALMIGMAGYHFFEGLTWMDSFVNAAMILSGMGPLAPLNTTAGKLFAGCYALFSGLAFLTSVGILVAPAYHRFMHKFHLKTDPED